jgi:hypothetical protein
MNAYTKNTERSKINDLLLCLKFLEKEEQAKHKTSRREIIKIRTKIKKRDKKHKDQAIKICFLEKINKIDKSLANLNKKRGEIPKLRKSKMKREITRNTKEIQGIIMDLY